MRWRELKSNAGRPTETERKINLVLSLIILLSLLHRVSLTYFHLEYKKIQVMMKSQKMDERLKEYKEVLNQNQEFMRNIDILKNTTDFKQQNKIKMV